MMSLTKRIWRTILLAVVALTSVLIMLLIHHVSRSNNNLSPFEENEFISQKLPTDLSMPCLYEKNMKNVGAEYIDSETIKVLAKLIFNAKKHVRGSKTSAYLGRAVIVMNKVLEHMNVTPESVYSRKTKEPINVCPERYKGGTFGFPLYYTGFETTNCRHSVPLSKLITIVQFFKLRNSDTSFEAVNKFLSSSFETFPGVKVLLATNLQQMTTILKTQQKDTDIFFMENYSEGKALNKMILNVKTQYVLIARNVEFFTEDSRLERLIGEIESLNIELSGGSFRNRHGHWNKGCFQVLYRNFTLKYFEGYDESLHECLFCDFISGPFVSTTKYLIENKFDDLNENNGLYEDFFLRTFQKGEERVVCPDSMFHVDSTYHSNLEWNHFMNKWRLNILVTSNGLNINLNSDLKTLNGKRSSIMSLRTLQKASDAVKVIMLACLEADVVCELQEGTAFGAIKMGKTIPWDIDFDLRFVSNNCTRCQNLADVFRKRGIHFGDFVTVCCTKKLKLGEINYVGLNFNGYGGDISGHPVLDSDLLTEKGIEPTKALFDGVWVNVPRNPGMTMRNRYGRELYQHADHWRYVKNGLRRMNYTTNVFLPCTTPGSHDCLDRYNADGTLQFFHLLP